MSDTANTTDELDGIDEQPEPTPKTDPPAIGDAVPAVNEPTDEKPARTTGLRKPTGPARGAMAATAMAAVPASGLVGSFVYGNFGPAGLAATAATGLAAGGVALAVRSKRRAEERAKAKTDKPGLPPHTLGGLKGLLAKSKERAAGRRQAMADRRAGKQGGGLAGGLGGVGRRVAGAAGAAAGRARSAAGRSPGGGRAAGTATGRGAGTPTGSRHAAGGKTPVGGRSAAGRPGAGGARHAGAAGRPHGGGRVAGAGRAVGGGSGRGAGGGRGRPAGGAGRYINPATGRPMTPHQVSSAIRRQQRAQRIVNGGSYPKKIARWAGRHPKAIGLAAAGIGGVAAAVMFAPLAAAAAVGLGAFGAARHPAFRNAVTIAGRGVGRHSARLGRWMRGQWLAWRRRKTPLEGDIVDDPPVAPSEPDIIDAEIVPEPAPPARGQPALSTTPAAPPAPEPEPFAPPHRQPRLITTGNTSTTSEEKTVMTQPFETANEALANVSFEPESGMHAEGAVDAIPGLLAGTAGSIRGVLATIAEQLPQAAESLEHLQGIADALEGLGTQASEQISAWKQSASWVWQGQD